jgi:hypothetical protein
MKKSNCLLLIIIVTCCLPASIFSQAKSPLKLGLRIAPNMGWMNPSTKGYDNEGVSVGGTIGFMGEYYFTENYAFATGLNFSSISGRLQYADSLFVPDKNDVEYGMVHRKYKFLYLEIPLMVKMSTKTFGKMSYYGQVGFGTGFRLKASVREEFDPETGESPDEQNYAFNNGTTVIRESILAGIGLAYHFDESSQLLIGINYSNSLNNVLTLKNFASGLDEKSTLNFLELNIGFLF